MLVATVLLHRNAIILIKSEVKSREWSWWIYAPTSLLAAPISTQHGHWQQGILCSQKRGVSVINQLSSKGEG